MSVDRPNFERARAIQLAASEAETSGIVADLFRRNNERRAYDDPSQSHKGRNRLFLFTGVAAVGAIGAAVVTHIKI